jgi:hypothetical protein
LWTLHADALIGIEPWRLIPTPTARRDEERGRDRSSCSECQRADPSDDARWFTESEVGHARESEQGSENPGGNDDGAAVRHARSGSADGFSAATASAPTVSRDASIRRLLLVGCEKRANLEPIPKVVWQGCPAPFKFDRRA